MTTKIFSVGYSITEAYNGKHKNTSSQWKSVVGKDALDAILKVKKIVEKPSSYRDDETGKTVKVTRTEFIANSVTLSASTE